MQLPAIIQKACSRLEDIDIEVTDKSALLKNTKKRKMATLERHRELGEKIACIDTLHAKRKHVKRKLSANEHELKYLQQLRDMETNNQDLDVVITCKESKIEKQRKRLAQIKDELSLADTDNTVEQLHKTIKELSVQSKEEGDIESEQAELERERLHCNLMISRYGAKTQVREGKALAL